MENQNNDSFIVQMAQIKDYISQQLQSGLQPNEIHAQLKQAGWQDDAIQQAFQLYQAQVVPNFGPVVSAPAAVELATQGQAMPQTQTAVQQPVPATVTRGRIKTGWLLFKQSIRVLKNNKKLTRYVVMSFIASLILTIIFAVIFFVERHVLLENYATDSSGTLAFKPAGYVVALLYYVLAFFIINLYSAGLVANVIDLFHGRSQPYGNYMKVARSKSVKILVFSVIEATIGLILRAIAERSKLLGRIVAWLLGAMWSLARLFVVPLIVTSDEGAVTAIKDSTKLLVATWGENLVGRVSFGGIAVILFMLVLIPVSFAVVFLSVVLGGVVGALIAIVIVVLLCLAFSLVISTASSVLNTALFYYAQYKQIPAAFDAELINSVFILRKRRGWFRRKTA